MKLKHIVVGLGSIGRRHAELLLEDGHEVVGVDISPEIDFEFPVYNNLESINGSKFDMAWICTPSNLHSEDALKALSMGLHVFIEKPIAADLESAISVLKTWEEMVEKTMVWVGCNMRYHPLVLRLKEEIDKGVIGEPVIYRYHFSYYLPYMRPGKDYRQIYAAHAEAGGGIILDDIHEIDLALWFGGPVKEVTGLAVNSGTLDMNVEDIGHICLQHENGRFSEIHMDFLRRDRSRGMEAVGEKGTLEWRGNGARPEQASLTLFKPGDEEGSQVLLEQGLTDYKDVFQKQLKSVLSSISDKNKYKVRLTESIEALKVALKVKKNYFCNSDIKNVDS